MHDESCAAVGQIKHRGHPTQCICGHGAAAVSAQLQIYLILKYTDKLYLTMLPYMEYLILFLCGKLD